MASSVILSNFFEEQLTQNHPQCLSGLSRALSYNLSRNNCIRNGKWYFPLGELSDRDKRFKFFVEILLTLVSVVEGVVNREGVPSLVPEAATPSN